MSNGCQVCCTSQKSLMRVKQEVPREGDGDDEHVNILLSTLVSAPQDSESNPSGLKLIVHFTGHRLIG